MAMNKDRLGNALADRVLTFTGVVPGGTDETQLRNFMKALADEIIKEIVTYAVVTSSVSVSSVSGVTTGVGVSGPGSGTATGTVA